MIAVEVVLYYCGENAQTILKIIPSCGVAAVEV